MTRHGPPPGHDTSISTSRTAAGSAAGAALPPIVRANERRLALLSALLVTLATLVVLLVGAEIVLRMAWKDPYMWDRRLMFFSEGRNFQNKTWGGIGYEPHAVIHAATYYITGLDPEKRVLEYEYTYTTNSFGRVQRNELDGAKPSVLFLGDSFTEGQGAPPWFYQLEAKWSRTSPYQLINGGTLGSGVEDWGRLYRDLAGSLTITKAVVIYIGDDWHRPVWQFPPQTLACLESSAQCIGDENFYGLPADSQQASALVDRIAQYRVHQLTSLRDSTNVVRRTAVYRHLVMPIVAKFRRSIQGVPSEEDNQLARTEVSKRVATDLVNTLGRENVLFIYLPQKHEIDRGPNVYARRANDFVTGSGYALVDGRAQCGLTAQDYHPHDGHPNSNGYAKIEACIRRAVTNAFAGTPGGTQ